MIGHLSHLEDGSGRSVAWDRQDEGLYRAVADRLRLANEDADLDLSDTGDARVPVAQSYQLFHAQRHNGVMVKFIPYPVPGDFPADPVRSRDVYSRWLPSMDQYL